MGEYAIHGKTFSSSSVPTGLYLVATPIGNLGDITLRAIEILAGCDLIACEDTRVTKKLLSRYGISAKTIAYNEHNAERQGTILLDRVATGKAIALVSDAGTPLMSDPGCRLVSDAVSRQLPVFPVPGATAPVAALVASGFETTPFTFCGFTPNKSGARKKFFERFLMFDTALVFFEAPTRLAASLKDMRDIFGRDRQVMIARELTKLHEEKRRGTLDELSEFYTENPVKGEVVIVVEAHLPADNMPDPEVLIKSLLEEMSVSRAAAEAARLTGQKKSGLYALALKLAGKTNTDG